MSGHRLDPNKIYAVYHGEEYVYPSSRKAAKELYCSFQTIIDACEHRYKTSVVDVRHVE